MNSTQCPHFDQLPIDNQLLKPTLPKGWVCLQDGSFRKVCTRQDLIDYSKKNSPMHCIFLNSITLEIFCSACNVEINDTSHHQAIKMRGLLFEADPEQEKVLFGAMQEYPQQFQKEKKGIAGTVCNELNSFVSSTLQLLAHTHPFNLVVKEADLNQMKNPFLKLLFEKILMIQSGKYRVVDVKDLETCLFSECKSFLSYQNRNPSHLKYQILRQLSSEFEFDGPVCEKGKITKAVNNQNFNPVPNTQATYGPMKALFSGSFLWKAECGDCKKQKSIEKSFECIRLEDSGGDDKKKVDMMDLILQTFEPSEDNSPFEDQFCDSCKHQQARRYNLKIEECSVKFPNIFLFQFGGDVNGLDVKLPDELDLSKFVKEQISEPYVYQYLGSIGKVKRKYITHVRIEKRDYIFDDVLIKTDSKKLSSVKVAMYKLRPLTKNKNLSKNIESSFQVQVNCHVPLPDFWHIYVSELRVICPLVSPLICPHGYIKPGTGTKTNVDCKVPVQIYDYLLDEFGGTQTKIRRENSICKVCALRLQLIQQIKHSEKQMAMFADKLSNKKYKFCIDVEWFDGWKDYLYKQCQIPYNSTGFRRPGPINNKRGLLEDGGIQESYYKKISPEVWYFMRKFYGGGPLIAKAIGEASLAVVQAVDLRFQNIKQTIEMINIVNKY